LAAVMVLTSWCNGSRGKYANTTRVTKLASQQGITTSCQPSA